MNIKAKKAFNLTLPNLTKQARMRIMLSAIICGAFGHAQALPLGEQVQAGSMSFVRDAQSLNINQTSQKAIVNWQSFSIATNESVKLTQPVNGAAFFRIVGNDPSLIYGSLSATGSLFLSNPNGVLFGAGAQVDVGSIVATTLEITDKNFLAKRYKRYQFHGDSNASVINQGVIRASDGGYIALLGSTVENNGTLQANNGSVILGSAQSAMLDFYGDGLVRVKLDGDALNAVIKQTGNITADGGAVQLTTNARTAAINVDGVIQANSLVERNGVIRLEGGKNAKVSVSGTLSAAGNETATTGGRIEVTGEQVALFKGAKLDASGDAGGGTVLVGGDYQGKNAQVYNSRTAYVDKDATINVDAKNNGNGGKAIVWADEITRYYGSISAKGGKNGGNGGFAEVSGKRLLTFLGKVDLSAANGVGGNLLLDPLNITLTNVDNNTTGFTVPGDLTEAFADDAGLTSTFNVNAGGSFAGITAGSTITLQATNDINVNTAFNVATATGTANNSLVLQANNNINVNAAVTTTGTGSISMTADADTSGAGGVTLAANLSAGTGAINLSGATVSGTGNIASPGLKTITATTGTSTLSGVISGAGGLTKAGAGTLTLTGNNTYTGATTVSTGTLGIQGTHASATSLAAGATVAFGGATNRTYATVFSGAGNIVKDGTNTATLTGANTYTGNTTINTGTLAGILGATSSLTVNAGATYSLNNANRTIGSLAGAGNVIPGTGNRTLTTGGNNTSTTFSGVLGNGAGTLNLTKTGTGVLTLSGANTYTGATTINAGTLQFAGGAAIADTSAVTLANTAGATLDLNGTNETIGSLAGGGAAGGNVTLGAGTLITGNNNTSTAYSGVISGGGNLTKIGSGTFTLSGANTYSGVTNINAGTLAANNNAALGSAAGGTTVASGATLAIQGNRTITDALTITGNGVGGTAGALRNISGNNTYSGAIALGAGGARINSDANTLTISGAANITGAEPLTVGGTGSTTISKVIATGAGSVTKDGAGTLTLSGANAYTGTTTVTAGTLTMGANNVFADTSSILVNGGALNANTRTDIVAGVRLDSGSITGTSGALTSTSAYDLRSGTVSKILGGAVGLNKTTAGTVTLSGANTYTGATNISAGTVIASSANALGAIGGGTTVASSATLNVNNVTLAESALSINGTGVGGAGALTGTGAAVVSGAVTTTGASNIGTTSAASTLTLNGLVTATAGNLGIVGTGNVIATNNAGNNFGTVNINSANNVSLRDTNGIVLGNGASLLTGNLSLQTGGAITQTDSITVGGVTTLNAGAANDITLNNVANNFNSVAITNGRDVNVVDANALTLNASSVRTINARTLSSDLTLGGNITAMGAGDAIVLASAGNFINASNSNLTAGTGRWLVYSTDPTLDNRGAGLLAAYDFKQYNTVFGGAIAGSGDGFIYSLAPTITPTLMGSATKTYDGTTTAPIGSLALGQTGAIDGDAITLAGLSSATYDDKNAGVGKTVSASGISFIGTGANNSGKTVYGYQLASPTATGAVGTINQRAITVTAATDTKTYDANISSVGLPTITTGSIVGGDSATFSQTFDNKNAGTGKTLTAAGTVTDGNGGNNYAVTFVTDNTGVINPLAITGAITANNKTYDANNSAVIASRNLTGVIIGDIVSYTGGTATFDNKNAGTGKTVTATGLSLSGGDAGNYTVNTTAVTTADIAKADIVAVTGITANNKVYDATTAASLNTGAAAYTGIIGGDNLTVATAAGAFVDQNAGVGKTVNVSGISLGGADAGNYNLTTTTANTTADINQRAITVTANPGQSKIFGAADPLSFAFTVGGLGLVGADTLTGALDRVAGEIVGGYAINQGTLAASSNYILNYFGNNFNILAPSTTGGGNPRNAAGLVDLNPSLGNYTNQQLFVLNVGFTAAGADSEGSAACEENPESLAKDKDFILMLNYGLNLPKGVNTSCDKHSGDKT